MDSTIRKALTTARFRTANLTRDHRSHMPHKYVSTVKTGAFRPDTSCWFCGNPRGAIIHGFRR